jgi:hypothetical protein
MLTFIFGAGASNDALTKESIGVALPPPLANDLFNAVDRPAVRARMAMFPEAAGLMDRLDRKTRTGGTGEPTTVEAELRQVRDLSQVDRSLEVDLLATRHYLQRLLWDAGNSVLDADANITNYVSLVYEVERLRARTQVRVDFISFNYDFLLERALEYQARWAFDSMDAYVNPHGGVFKPHGSVDWGRVISAPDMSHYDAHDWRSLDRRAEEVGITPDIQKIGEPGLIRIGAGSIVPALAIPVETKSQFECPLEHLDVMWTRLGETRLLVSIGWKAGEVDFVQKLVGHLRSDCLVELVTKSPEGGELVQSRLEAAGFKGAITRSAGGFREWLNGTRLNDLAVRVEAIAATEPQYRLA